MKKYLITSVLLLFLGTAFAQNPFGHRDTTVKSRAVYGSDDRISASLLGYSDYTRATMVAVQKSQFKGDYLTGYSLAQILMWQFRDEDPQYVDESVRFKDEPAFGFCTGFLIAPDLLVTAGHCVNETNYKDSEWILDFTNDLKYSPGDKIYIPKSKRYKVVEVVDQKLTEFEGSNQDYCILRLDRPCERMPFRIRTGGWPSQGDEVNMVGAPRGLPLKMVRNAEITVNTSNRYFQTNLDAFGGNSGGPVYNSAGFIEGILVRGPTVEFYVDEECHCVKTENYTELYASFVGAHVHRITDLPWQYLTEAIYENIEYAVKNDDDVRLKKYLAYTWVFDEATLADREPLVIVAARAGNTDAVKQMIETGADINTRSLSGMTLMHFAINSSNLDLFEYLIRYGYDLDSLDENGRNAVFWAIDAHNPSMMEELIRKGANVSLKDKVNGDTPLHYAVRENNMLMVETALNAGVDIMATNNDGYTAKKLAKKLKYKELKKYLRKQQKQRK